MLKKTDFRVYVTAIVQGKVWNIYPEGDHDEYKDDIMKTFSHDEHAPFTAYCESLDDIVTDVLNHPDFVSCKLSYLSIIVTTSSKEKHKLFYPMLSKDVLTDNNVDNR